MRGDSKDSGFADVQAAGYGGRETLLVLRRLAQTQAENVVGHRLRTGQAELPAQIVPGDRAKGAPERRLCAVELDPVRDHVAHGWVGPAELCIDQCAQLGEVVVAIEPDDH